MLHFFSLLFCQNSDTDDEAELNIFCVTCGHEISQRGALRHMEKCYTRVRRLQINSSSTGSSLIIHTHPIVLDCSAFP